MKVMRKCTPEDQTQNPMQNSLGSQLIIRAEVEMYKIRKTKSKREK